MPTSEEYASLAATSAETAATVADALTSAAGTLAAIETQLGISNTTAISAADTAAASASTAATAAALAQSYIAGAAPFGLFVNLGSVTVPADINVALSTGYSAEGQGAGYYISDSLANSTLAAAHPRFCKADASGRYFRLAGDCIVAEQAGAVGDGVTDDTTALQAALATGRDVFLPTGYSFKFTSNLTLSNNYQRFGGPAVLIPSGACGVVVNTGATGVELDLTFNAPAHTGVALTINNASRVRITRLHGLDVNNLLYITKGNTVSLDWCWATCRGYGITWYGDALNRSDILHLGNVVIAPAAGQYGLDWDGNCHSLIIKYLGLVCSSTGTVSSGNAKGMVVRNTSGSTAPAIGRIGHIEVDYSGTHGIDVQAGSDYEFVQSYVLGSTGDGIRVGAGINSREVRLSGGKYRGNTGYGINALGGVVLYAGNADLQSNTSGATNGNVWTEPLRMALDTTAYFALASGNPLLAFDTNDYMAYDRTANTAAMYIGGAAAYSATASAFTVGGTMKVQAASGTGAGVVGYASGNVTYGDGSAQRTLVNTDAAQTLTNKTFAFGSNTVSTTLAQLNSAISDADLVRDWTTIDTKATTSGTAVTFSSIPATYNDLMVRIIGVGQTGVAQTDFNILLSADGTTFSTAVAIGSVPATGALSSGGVNIPRYRGDGGFLIGSCFTAVQTSPSVSSVGDIGCDWRITGGIAAIRFTLTANAFNAGSIVLYGR